MRYWRYHDAETRFGEMLDASLQEGPQIVSREGHPEAVLVSLEEWQAVTGGPGHKAEGEGARTLKDVLLNPGARSELELPLRGQYHRRPPVAFDD